MINPMQPASRRHLSNGEYYWKNTFHLQPQNWQIFDSRPSDLGVPWLKGQGYYKGG